MWLIIILLIICLIIGIVSYFLNDKDPGCGLIGIVVPIIILSIILMISISASYGTYVNTRAFYDGIIEQYRDCITIYEDAAILDIKRAALTDFVYQGYQENINKMIIDLKDQKKIKKTGRGLMEN